MPSYRVSVDILATRPGVAHESVLPAAEATVSRTHRVEDRSIEVIGGQPQIHLRFGVAASNHRFEDEDAEAVVQAVVAELDRVAHCGRWTLRRGRGGRWFPVRAGWAPL